MFIVTLRFSHNRGLAAQHMDAHKAWIRRGVEDGVFLLVGSLQPNSGGAIIAHNISLPSLRERVAQDPFVIEGIVATEILEVAPSLTDARLAFLKAEAPA